MPIYTIGHSTRSLKDFIEIMKHYKIELLIDVRRFPSSKKFPWFNKDSLEKELNKNKIAYLHFPKLGGFRKEGYEKFSRSEEFNDATDKLLELINGKNAVVMCAEILWWRCHRRYIANKLVSLGFNVVHVWNEKKVQEHDVKSSDVKSKLNLKIFCNKEI